MLKQMQTEYKVLDHGYVRYVDHLGSDARIIQAARVSYHSTSIKRKRNENIHDNTNDNYNNTNY